MPAMGIRSAWGLKAGALDGRFKRRCSAFLKRVTIMVVSHWLQQVVGLVFCWMNRSRQQKLSKNGGIHFWIFRINMRKQNFKKQPSIVFFLLLKYRFAFWVRVCSFCVQRLMLRPGFIYLVNIMPECINWCLKAFTNVPIVCQSITFYGVWGP